MKINENEPCWKCDNCNVVKPESDFGDPGHMSGGTAFGYDIDTCVCTICAQKVDEAWYEDLYQYEHALEEEALREDTKTETDAEGPAK